MKIVFLGTPRCAVRSLDALVRAGSPPRLVVCQPDRPAGRGRKLAPPAVKRAALEHGIEVYQPSRVRTRDFRERLEAAEPDILVVVAYGRILPGRVLELAPGGAVNVHFSMLPRYRGAAPVQWALVRGESSTGVTTMQMNERMDEGDILLAREMAIRPGEHAPSVEERLSSVGADLLMKTLQALQEGTLEPRPQDHSAATLAPLLRREDGEIDPGLPSAAIEGRVRGFDPWPGVWVERAGRRLRLVSVRSLDEPRVSAPAGSLIEKRRDGIVMACGQGSRLLLHEVQPEGKRVLAARDAVNGRQLALGDRLERIGSAAPPRDR